MYKIYLRISAIFYVALFFCGASCENTANAAWCVRVKNNSEKDIYFVVGLNWINSGYYPTTQLPNDSTRIWHVKPHQAMPLNYYPAKKVYDNSSDSIALFVFDPDTIAKYT
ncbi:MAG: hypothetical protein LBL79_02715 [Prevotella sp.]|jgi:hypothetical protein|nr:hypothetical protein [Prevotella sp.]